jgi:predicted TPR repeat methyltransferase
MESINLAKSYNEIADIWEADMRHSQYGLSMIGRAIEYCSTKKNALDVGCGSGGRIVGKIVEAEFRLDGIDISEAMLKIARTKHPGVVFKQADIRDWETDQQYDLIVAWDSIFHLPMSAQQTIIEKLCGMLSPQGILLYTFGDAVGDYVDIWHNEQFSYGSIGISENLKAVADAGCVCKHLELDQFPEKHVCIIVEKPD